VRSPARLFVLAGALVVVALIAVSVVMLMAPARVVAPIVSIEYSQFKAVPDFPSSSHTTTGPDRIREFTALAKKYSIDVTHFDQNLNDDCTGGLATDITLKFSDSTTARLHLYDCGRTVARGSFVSDATALFTTWRIADDVG
jgi:hypothetical protein